MKPAPLIAPAAVLALIACNGPKPTAATKAEQAATSAHSINPNTNLAEANAASPHVVGSEYAATLAADDLFEIASANLAVHKTRNPDVKDLAQALIPAHQQSLAGLKAAAASARPPIAVAPALNPDQQAKLDALRSLAGPAFDHTFLQQQVDVHGTALKLIAGFAEDGDVPTLKQHARTIEAAVHEHSVRAQDLRSTYSSPERGGGPPKAVEGAPGPH